MGNVEEAADVWTYGRMGLTLVNPIHHSRGPVARETTVTDLIAV